jgi:hypothetical protein
MLHIMTRRRRNEELPKVPLPMLAVVGILLGGGGGWLATMPPAERANLVQEAAAPVSEAVGLMTPEPRPFRPFSGCNDARAAGYENIRADEPNYRPDWDGDGDGLACEPHR